MDHQIDVFGMAEMNKYWPKIEEKNGLYEQTWKWFKSIHTSCAYNRMEVPETVRQSGGTALFSIDQAAHRAETKGNDPLGRWCWTRYRGKGGITLRIVSAYRPVASHDKPTSAYKQQEKYLLQQNIDTDPREQFWIDLDSALSDWHSKGDQIIVMLDANEDVRKAAVTRHFEEWNMREVILERHGNTAPATHSTGSYPIDGIFASTNIDIRAGGYMGHEAGEGDHRCLWIDVSFVSAFGHNLPVIMRPYMQRLQLSNTRTVQRFEQQVTRFVRKHELQRRITALERHKATTSLET